MHRDCFSKQDEENPSKVEQVNASHQLGLTGVKQTTYHKTKAVIYTTIKM
jgi:hypothetical protein